MIRQKSIYLPEPRDPSIKKVVVFDLDETLVHCLEDFEDQQVDHVITIKFPDGDIVDAGLNIRPFAIDTLRAANENF